MVTAAQAISWFDPWIGYRDDGGTKMWMLGLAPHWPGSAWCGKTQEVLVHELSLDISPTTDARIIYVPWAVLDAKKAGEWISSYQSHPGDWVCFDWLYSGRRDGLADHIGMIIHNDPSLPYVYTIEGNTTDENGVGPRGVFIRRRYRVDILGCVNRQKYYTKSPTPITVPIGPIAENQDLNKWIDKDHIKTLQKILKVDVDGIVGKQTITALQKKLGTTADGVLSGPASRAVVALQRRIGMSDSQVDGILGPITGKKFTTYLDKGGNLTPDTPHHDPVPPRLNVDGIAGLETIKAWQRYEGTTVDGIVSGQDAGWHSLLPRANWTTVKWQNPGEADGSRLIKHVQKRLGLANPDGIVGPKTAKAIQKWVGVTRDGILGPKSVKALQRKLNS